MKIQTKQLQIGKIANQELSLPVLEFGQGEKTVGIVGGVHGNEPESLFILREVLKRVKKPKLKVKILTGANPFALITDTRVNLFDYKDLNRSFPGNKNGTLTDRIAAAIFEEFSDCDVVIDIHSVTNIGAFMGMELGASKDKLLKRTREINRLLNPPYIWNAVEGNKYEDAMDEAYLKIGICGIGVEVPRLEFLDKKLMNKIVNGFIAIIEGKKVKKLTKPIPVLANAKRYFSDFGGIYIPKAKLMSEVKTGDLIGIITDLTNMQDFEIRSKFSGILFVQSSRKLVKTGDKIYVVTEKIGEFQ